MQAQPSTLEPDGHAAWRHHLRRRRFGDGCGVRVDPRRGRELHDSRAQDQLPASVLEREAPRDRTCREGREDDRSHGVRRDRCRGTTRRPCDEHVHDAPRRSERGALIRGTMLRRAEDVSERPHWGDARGATGATATEERLGETMFRRLIVIATLVIALGAFEGPTASADSSNETFGFLAGSGFLCGLAPTACPDVSRADNGDTIQIAGSGALTTNPKTAAVAAPSRTSEATPRSRAALGR